MNTPRPCLSVAVPCFDEADTVAALVGRVLASPWTAQVIVVDDGSSDGTAKVLADLVAELDDPRLDVVTHEWGHFALLGHVNGSPELTMFPSVHDGMQTLGRGDMKGVVGLYPAR